MKRNLPLDDTYRIIQVGKFAYLGMTRQEIGNKIGYSFQTVKRIMQLPKYKQFYEEYSETQLRAAAQGEVQ